MPTGRRKSLIVQTSWWKSTSTLKHTQLHERGFGAWRSCPLCGACQAGVSGLEETFPWWAAQWGARGQSPWPAEESRDTGPQTEHASAQYVVREKQFGPSVRNCLLTRTSRDAGVSGLGHSMPFCPLMRWEGSLYAVATDTSRTLHFQIIFN